MKPVTDPSVLSQLNSKSPVSDPALLAQLDGTTEGNMFSDIIPEIKKAASENIDTIKGAYEGYEKKGHLEATKDVGKAILAVPGFIASPVTGAARSLIGHPLAAATHGIGSIINPEVAAKDNPQEMYEHAKGGVDTAMMAIAPRGASPVGPRQLPSSVPAATELKKAAVDVYQDPAIKSIPIPPKEVSGLAGGIENDLVQQGFRPTAGNAPGTFAEIKKLYPPEAAPASQFEILQAEMNGLPPPVKTPAITSVSVDDIRAARRALNMTEKQRDPFNQPTPDAVAARRAIEKIDGFLDGIAPELRQANANYRAAKQAQGIDYRVMKAEHRAAKTGSGSNIENTMRQEVDKIPNRGLSPQQIALRDQIVEGTTGRNALRKVGKLGVQDGLSLLLHAGAGTASGGATVPLAVAGTMARKIGEMLTRGQINNLSKSIRSNAPLAKALAASPRYAQIPKGAKAVAAALLSQGAPRATPLIGGMVPSYADQDRR